MMLGLNGFLLEKSAQTIMRSWSTAAQHILISDPSSIPGLMESLKNGNVLNPQKGLQSGQEETDDVPTSLTFPNGRNLLESYGYSEFYFMRQMFWPFFIQTLLEMMIFTAVFIWYRKEQEKKKRKYEDRLMKLLELAESGQPVPLIPDEAYTAVEDSLIKTVGKLRISRDQALAEKAAYTENLENIAHQIKTPVSSLSLELEQMQDDSGLKEKMRRQTAHIDDLLSRLLMHARVQSGVAEFDQAEVDVFSILEVAADSLQPLADSKQIQIEVPWKENISFTGDFHWSCEALICLIHNSLQSSPEHSVIFCTYGSNPLYTWIRIDDQGSGMHQEDTGKLFQRFSTTTDNIRNSFGIGMSLAQSVFEKQSGIIQTCSLAEGGTRFEIRIYHHSSESS